MPAYLASHLRYGAALRRIFRFDSPTAWRQTDIIDSIRAKMPRSLHVRNLDENLVTRLKIRAARHGRSAEAEHRAILQQALESEATPSFEDLAAELRKLTSKRRQTASEDLQREGREER